jgi:hypothetical protein
MMPPEADEGLVGRIVAEGSDIKISSVEVFRALPNLSV